MAQQRQREKPQQIADELRRLIIEGHLKEGDSLGHEPDLIERFGVSRPSLREALRILEAEGLISVVRGVLGGVVVHRPDHRQAALQAGALEAWHHASLRVHDGLVGLADNSQLQRLYADLKIPLRRYQLSLVALPQQPPRSQREHEAILAALENGDVDGAVAALTAHITSLKETLLKRSSAG